MDEERNSRIVQEIESLLRRGVCRHDDHWIWVERR